MVHGSPVMEIRSARDVRMLRFISQRHPELMESLDKQIRAHYNFDGSASEEADTKEGKSSKADSAVKVAKRGRKRGLTDGCHKS